MEYNLTTAGGSELWQREVRVGTAEQTPRLSLPMRWELYGHSA